jgi:peptidoglycan/LPS O-acetylase OafA/YrhL
MKAWSTARRLAKATPARRNRYVDFLRASAIVIVVFGHWLAAAPHAAEDGLQIVKMLGVAPWTHGLTWALQVMPVFFIVGGYANGASWEAALRDGISYREWLHARMNRLVAPLLPLLLVWAGLAATAGGLGVDPMLLSNASRLALIPTWFLAVYIIVVLLVPATSAAWRRYGLSSFWLPVSAAVLVDALAFGQGFLPLRWANYAFVWLAVHQLGFLWRSHRADDYAIAGGWALGGVAFLVFLVQVADYPVAMLTVPGAEFSNTRPPTVALVALAALQFGTLCLFQTVVRRWLERPWVWAATVLINGSIMTIFLWHSTVQVLLIGLAYGLGGIGLGWEPGSAVWWTTRPLWLLVMTLTLMPIVLLFSRYERGSRKTTGSGLAPAIQVSGALLMCGGVAQLAWAGMSAAEPPWVRLLPLALSLAGAAMVLFSGRPQKSTGDAG